MGEPVKYDYKGREIRLCCSGCIASFEKEPQKYFDQIDKAMIEDQLSHYPLETCMVSGKKLQGAMGEPINLIYKNRLVRLCCPACKEGLAKDPEGYIRKLDEAVIEKQKEKYPLEICVVSGEKISAMEKPVDIVIANRLLRLCCPDCQKAIEKDPLTYLSKVESKPETKAQKSEQK